MSRVRIGTAGLLASSLLAGSASAADVYQPEEPILAPEERINEGWRVALTARFWYFLETDVYHLAFPDTATYSSAETIGVPFPGGSISITPPGLGGTTFSLTAFYGEGEGDFGGFEPFNNLGLFQGTREVSRLDIEGIAQIPVVDGVTGILGARFIRFVRDETLVDVLAPIIPQSPIDLLAEQHYYLGEIGFGVNRPAWESFVFFGNVTGMFGYADLVDFSNSAGGGLGALGTTADKLEGGVAGIDTNAGIGLQLSENLLLSGRYRLFYLSNPDFEFTEGGTFIHGPEANLTVSFGG